MIFFYGGAVILGVFIGYTGSPSAGVAAFVVATLLVVKMHRRVLRNSRNALGLEFGRARELNASTPSRAWKYLPLLDPTTDATLAKKGLRAAAEPSFVGEAAASEVIRFAQSRPELDRNRLLDHASRVAPFMSESFRSAGLTAPANELLAATFVFGIEMAAYEGMLMGLSDARAATPCVEGLGHIALTAAKSEVLGDMALVTLNLAAHYGYYRAKSGRMPLGLAHAPLN